MDTIASEDEPFELRWTAERARRTARLHLLACVLGGGAAAAATLAGWGVAAEAGISEETPSVAAIAAGAVALATFLLAAGFLVLGHAAVTELRAAGAGGLRMLADALVADDGTRVRVLAAKVRSGRVDLALAGGGQRTLSLDRRRHRALLRHLRAAGIAVSRGLGEIELLLWIPVLTAAVGAALVASALVEAAATVGVLWLVLEAPGLFVALLLCGLCAVGWRWVVRAR